ncbi:coagulation factor X [Drosophila biarmipes]|uniref:coagulation factor X n=1 Tax=Drosophila biarmipes TaxID=125945 RepID=UPI0007E6BCFD|nr:coagulation factor X [Drosophila biarmipes]
MFSLLTPIAVLASLLVICSNSASARLLNNDCGASYQQSLVGPWTALLHENGKIFCAGTLITKSFILTAANCIKSDTIVKVRLGEYGRNQIELAEDHLVDFSLRYRYYSNDSHGNDIGLLKLTKEVQFKTYLRPICIILDSSNKPKVNQFIGTAWRQINDNNMYGTRELGLIRIERKPQDCEEIDLYTQFCAGSSGNSQSCDGLSGSPLIQNHIYENQNRFVQLGISTLSDMDCRGAQGYTEVMHFYWWIEDVVALFEGAEAYRPRKSFSASATSTRIYPKSI